MEPLNLVEPLYAREIHGFNTTADLNIPRLIDEASKRWLRPNEVYAILSNHKLWNIQPQPVNLPSSGSLLLFDRKMLRNFRKDGHNWRKKKDGKTVQEAHEKLKMGNEEMIHVYYARNEDDLYFYRRCYWLLDRNLERIVLVHYRQTSEESTIQPSSIPIKPKEAFHSISPVRSSNASNHMDLSNCVFEEINSGEDRLSYTGCTFQSVKPNECENHKTSLDENDGLYWKELMESTFDLCAQENGIITSSEKQAVYQPTSLENHPGSDRHQMKDHQKIDPQFHMGDTAGSVDSQIAYLDGNMIGNAFNDNILLTQDGLEKWDYIVENAKELLDGPQLQIQDSNNHMQNDFPETFPSSYQEQVFTIVDISPSYTYHMEETKIIVVGYFHDSHKHLESSNVFCVIGDNCVLAYPLQVGVYRMTALTHLPGSVDLFLTLDGHTPISQVIGFGYRSLANSPSNSREKNPGVGKEISDNHRDYKILLRLVRLLFTTTNSYSVLLNKLSLSSMRDVKKFTSATTSFLENQWKRFLNANEDVVSASSITNHDLLELILKNKLQEWLLLRVAEGCRVPSRDSQGQGIIHLCAMLDYTWAIRLYSLSRLTLNFRDTHGWTPLHWAAYYSREKTVATLLSAGANPSLVADPTPNFPGGCTPADLASQEGYEGLSAYLSEQGLRAHFQAMTESGNASCSQVPCSVDSTSIENVNPENLSEQELCLKDSLTAYRNAADAADRIQVSFRERSLKQQMKIAQLKSESEAAGIVAALKIQNAFKNHIRHKMMKATVTIQGTFRTWQARKNFLNMRRQAVRIQAAFRGLRERKQYQKICWSVGVLEKALFRWRRKRKGLRGLQTESGTDTRQMEEENCIEDEFFQISREQAEDRVRRSVVRVQAMFRSYRTQQEYRRMKLAYNQATLECDEFGDPSNDL